MIRIRLMASMAERRKAVLSLAILINFLMLSAGEI